MIVKHMINAAHTDKYKMLWIDRRPDACFGSEVGPGKAVKRK